MIQIESDHRTNSTHEGLSSKLMKRTKLISAARLDTVYASSQVQGEFKNRTLQFYDRNVSIGKFLANGAFGMVFANNYDIIKFEVTEKPKLLEMDLTFWAGERGYGPVLRRWGKLVITEEDFNDLVDEMRENTTGDLPYWVDRLVPGAMPSVYYIILERWATDLRRWIKKGNALNSIRIDVMAKFVEGIREMHKLGITHMDLLPKNILIQVDAANNITALGLADFGNSQTRKEWFFIEPDKTRKLFVNYFVKHKESLKIGEALYNAKPSPRSSPKQAAIFWFLHEPFNFDWVVPQFYLLQAPTKKLPNVPALKLPCRFDFTLPWSKEGFLQTRIVVDGGTTKMVGQVFGLWSLPFLRERLEKRSSNLASKEFVWTDNKGIYKLRRAEEKNFCVSAVIRKDQTGYFIEML